MRPIDADTLLSDRMKTKFYYLPNGDVAIPLIDVEHAPTIDALALLEEQEPIVRCKDCQHSCDYTDIFPDRAYRCTKNGGYHDGSWFCADGKRQ